MLELKNNDHLSKTFSNFEKRIEQNLIVLYKNTSESKKKFKEIEKRLKKLEQGNWKNAKSLNRGILVGFGTLFNTKQRERSRNYCTMLELR